MNDKRKRRKSFDFHLSDIISCTYLAHRHYGFKWLYFYLSVLFIPISVYNVGNDTVNHIVKERLAHETIVVSNDILHVEHTHDVSYKIGCFC